MKIAIANTARIWGGAEKILVELVAGLVAHGHHITLLVRPGAPLSHRVPEGAGCVTLPGGMDMNPVGVITSAAVLRKLDADLLVAWTTKDVKIAGLGARLARVPVLVRRAYATGLPRTLRHRLYHEWIPYRYMTNAEATKQSLLESVPSLRGEDVAVIYNGIDVRAIDAVRPTTLDLPSEALVVGFISRLDRVKGVRELIAAWPLIASRVPNAHLVIAGTGELAPEVQVQLPDLERVHLLGFRRDAVGVLKSVDVLVLPSYREGTPNIIMEAMACGRAIVATAVGGTSELVQNGVHARLIPARDTAAITRALIEMLNDETLRQRLGAAARTRIRDFAFDSMVNRYVALFEQVASGYRRATAD